MDEEVEITIKAKRPNEDNEVDALKRLLESCGYYDMQIEIKEKVKIT